MHHLLSHRFTMLAALFVGATVLSNPVFGQTDYSEDIDRIRSQITNLEAKSADIRTERDGLLKQVAAVDLEVSAIEDKRKNALDDLQQEDLSQQDSRRAKYLQLLEFEQRTVALNSTMPIYLEVASQDRLTNAMRDKDVNRLSRKQAYLNYLTRNQSTRIHALYTALRDSTTDDANSDISSLILYTDDLKQQLADQKKAKKGIERQVETLNRQLVANQASINELQESLNTLVRQSALTGTPSDDSTTNSQEFNTPIDAPVKRNFGDPKKAYGGQWTGVLYKAQSGQAVWAAAPGVVIFAKEHKTLGQLIIIDHGEELFSLYAHNDQLLVKLGDSVVAKQTIAQAGESGDVSSPALYFEIRSNGEPVDPLLLLDG